MRFYDKGCEPEDGDVRYITKFLWWPKRIGTMTVWLEFVTLQQRYDSSYATMDCTIAERWGFNDTVWRIGGYPPR